MSAEEAGEGAEGRDDGINEDDLAKLEVSKQIFKLSLSIDPIKLYHVCI